MKNAVLDGRIIAYVDEVGSGTRNQTILLNHGFASNALMNWQWPGWFEVLIEEGYRVIAFDNRGHGESTKFYEQEDYVHDLMAKDALDLLDTLEIDKAHVMGYSMGARLSSVLATNYRDRVDKLILAGNGCNMFESVSGGAKDIQEGLLAPSLEDVKSTLGFEFRQFAQLSNCDLPALAACIMEIWQPIPKAVFEGLKPQVLVMAGSEDELAITPEKLAAVIPNACYLPIPKRNHMNAVGDKVYKQEVLKFLASDA